MNPSEKLNSSSVTIVPEPCGEPCDAADRHDPANTYRAAWSAEDPPLASAEHVSAGRGAELREAMRRGFEIAIDRCKLTNGSDGYPPSPDFEFAARMLEEEIGRRDRAADGATQALLNGTAT